MEKQILLSVGFELTTSCIRGKRFTARKPHGRERITPRLIWKYLESIFLQRHPSDSMWHREETSESWSLKVSIKILKVLEYFNKIIKINQKMYFRFAIEAYCLLRLGLFPSFENFLGFTGNVPPVLPGYVFARLYRIFIWGFKSSQP